MNSYMMMDAANQYASKGWALWAVFPLHNAPDGRCSCDKPDCTSPGKHPRTRRGLRDASTDPWKLREWWTEWPEANVGVRTGSESGIVVLDVDPRHGGDESLKDRTIPPTLEAQTSAGGRHLYFRHPGGKVRNSTDLYPGLDVRGDGGYVVAPPSLHANGERYVWVNEGSDLADAPEWMLGRPSKSPSADGPIPEGQRNDRLTSIGGSLRARGQEFPAIEKQLLEINDACCTPPLPPDEVRKVAESVSGYPRGTGGKDPLGTTKRPKLIRMDDVQAEALEWLWPGRVPLGKVTLIAGDPGLGKSLATLDMAARVSTGREWPDGGPNMLGAAIVLSAEDGLADTIRPRLEAAGADLSHVAVPDNEHGPSLALCRDSLEETLDELEAMEGLRPPRLVVVDPITAYLGGIDSHKDSDVRTVLAPLASLAASRRVAIVLVAHLNKSQDQRAIHRTTGSVAFTASARAVWLVAKDKSDPQRRLFVPAKHNLGPDSAGMAYSIGTKELPKVGEVPVIRWEGDEVHLTADDVLGGPPGRRSPRQEHAEEWLISRLEDGPRSASEVFEEAEREGITKPTLRRAKEALNVRPRKRPEFQGPWEWSLPEGDA